MKINIRTLCIIIFFVIIELISIIFNYNIIFMTTVSIAVCSVIYFCKNIDKNFAIVFFILMYAFFLLSSEFVQEVFNVTNTRNITDEANIHSNIVLLLGIISLIIGYQFDLKRKVNLNLKDEKEKIPIIRKVSKRTFYLTYIFYILPALEKMLYVKNNSYLEYYTSYSSNLPVIVTMFETIAPIALAIFLATFPSKKECRIPIILYIIYNIVILLAGKRYYFIAAILFVISYFLMRNNKKNNEIWISKRSMVILVLLIPVVCVLLFAFSNLRMGNTISNMGYLDMLLTFFNRVGESNKVIKYGYMFKNDIGSRHIFAIGGIVDYFKYNAVTKFFTGSQIIRGQNVEYAINGNNFGMALTYVFSPNYFINGNGLGSCYLAELYQDLGYIGIIIGSIIYGIIIRNLFNITDSSIITRTLAIYMYVTLLRAPRDSYSCFLEEIINVKFLFFFLIIFLYSNQVYNNKSNRNG